MKIGASVGPELDRIEEVSEAFGSVEIAIGEMEVNPEEIDRTSLKQELEEKGLDLVVHLPFRQPLVTGVEELDSANVEYHRRLISYSKEIGAETVVIHVDNRYGSEQDEKHLETLEEIMNELDTAGERRGIDVAFENVPGNARPAVELEGLGDIAERNDLSLCLDICHAYVEEGQEGLEQFIDQYGHLISHLHVQDSIRGEDSHAAVGHGEIDWDSVGDKLAGFDGTATIEVFTEDMEYQEISRRKFLEALEN